MTLIRLWLLRFAFAFAGLMALVVVGLLTTSGQRMALSLVTHVAKISDFTLSIGRLEGSLFDRASIDRIEFADRNGTWMDLRNIRLTWSPLSLLRGHINVEQLAFESVKFVRKPVAPNQVSSQSGGSSVPLMRITLKRLQVDQLILGEAFAGATARFEIKASADLVDHRNGLAAQISARRLDQPGARVDAQLNYGGADRVLALQLSASEPAGGLVATILQMPQRPALSLKFSGEGSLDAWHADWSMSASDQPFVAGRVQLDRDGARHRLATDFSGYVQAIVPRSLSSLVAGKTTGSLIGFFAGVDRFDASHMLLTTDAIKLRGRGGFEQASSYAYGSLSLDVGRDDARPVDFTLPNDDKISLRKLRLSIALPDERTARDISLDLIAEDLTHPLGAMSKLNLLARARQPNPVGAGALSAERIMVQLKTHGFSSPANGLADTVGPLAQLELTGSLKAGALVVDRFHLGDATAHLVGRGEFSGNQQTGAARLTIGDLRRFSVLYGQQLDGRLDLDTTISAVMQNGVFAATLKGDAKELALGQGALAGLMGKTVKLSGDVARSALGKITLRSFDAHGSNLSIAAKGIYAHNAIELDHTIDVSDLSALQSGLAGSAKLEVRLHGTPKDLASRVRGTTKGVSLRGKAIERLAIQFDGKGPVAKHNGVVKLTGRIGERELAAKARLTLGQAGLFAAQDVDVRVGRNSLSGHARVEAGSASSGKLVLNASHLSDLSVVIGQKIAGALTGEVELREHQQQPSLELNVEAPLITFAGSTLKKLKATASLKNFINGINGRASVSFAQVSSNGSIARNLSLELRDRDGRMAFAGAGLVNDAQVKLDGSFKQQGKTIDVFVDRAALKQGALKVRLANSAQFVVSDRGVDIQRLKLSTGRGHVEVKGLAGANTLKLDAHLLRVPAQIANAFLPSLGLDGTINGRASVRGTPANPTATVETIWSQASARVMRENHIPPVSIELNGGVRNGVAKAEIDVRGPQAFALSIDGDVRLEPDNQMRFRLSGDVPLALGNAALAARATQLSGRAKISGIISGTTEVPKIDAEISIPNATVHDPSSGLKLRRLVGLLRLTERGVEIRTFKAESDLGGTLSVSGTVSREKNGIARTRLNAQLAQFKFNDRQLMAGEVDGNVTLAGPMDALAANGSVFIRRLDVIVPAAAPRSIATLNIKHINAPERIAKSVRSEKKPTSSSAPMRVALNLRIDAANRIFVKGRGLDAQLGGGLNVRGTSMTPVTDGAFMMQRGRLDVLGRRLEFRRGKILFDGGLEPVLDMEAVTAAGDVTIVVTISGVASKPVFKFTSSPELPEDEVIARLLFNKALVGLSPLQLVQLASEVDKIGGLSSGPGILDKLKRSVGVDVLDVSTDKTGAATVSAGRYVTDKTFVGVKQGATAGSSRVIIDHDFTKNLKARGEVGADGNSKLGIGLEWNY